MDTQTTAPSRLAYLDSVRGIAALMVFFGHYIGWVYAESRAVKWGALLANSADAVSFFFVLSGMVLAYPYLQFGKSLDMGKFFVTRLFRIYPGFLVVLLINALFSHRYELNKEGLLNLFIYNKNNFWEEAFLLRFFNNYYGAGWTLTIEMCFSFFMPFLILIGKSNRKLLIWLLAISLIISNIFGIFLFHFTLGALIAAYFTEIKADTFKKTFWYRYRTILLLASVVLFSFRQIHRIKPFGSTLIYLMDYFKIDFFTLSGIAAGLFIVYLIHFKKAQRFFEHPILVFYGKISYGVYLVHWALVAAMGAYWDSKILPLFPDKWTAFFVVMFICFVITTITATLMHYFIELPFMRMGKRFSGKMKATISV